MTTKKFNKGRTDQWLEKFNKDESRVFLMIGLKEDNTLTLMVDESQTPEMLAKIFEDLIESLRKVKSDK